MTKVERGWLMRSRDAVVLLLPDGEISPGQGLIGSDVDLWVGPDASFPMRLKGLGVVCSLRGPCRSQIMLASRPDSSFDLDHVDGVLIANPGAELRVSYPAANNLP